MQAVIEVVVPVFGLIAAGYVLARTPLLSTEGLRGLTNFVFYIAIPALLFRTLARGLPGGSLDFTILYAYFGGVAILYVLAMLTGRLVFAIGFAEQALFAMGAAFSNSVMLGIPLVYTAFGDDGIAPITLIITFHAIVLIGTTTVLVEIGQGSGTSITAIARATVVSLLRNPVIVAMAIGLGWDALDLPIPDLLDRFVNLLSGAAAPCALAALGGSLTTFRLGGNLRESAVMTVLKLIVLPVLVWLLATYVFPLAPTWRAVAVLVAALPIGSNVFVLAQKYRLYVARTASGILISTVLAVITVTLLLAILRPAG